MKGWKKLVLSTLMSRSIESGANQESRWGGVVNAVDISDVVAVYGGRLSIFQRSRGDVGIPVLGVFELGNVCHVLGCASLTAWGNKS